MADGCIEVVAGVIARGRNVLICQRPPGGHHPGKWEFPGGKLEIGESLPDALRRELKEELGIDAVPGPVLWHTQHRYPGRPCVALSFLLVTDYAGALTNRMFAAVRWVGLDTLHDYDFLEADREFVAQIESGRILLSAK